jgi:hypothetical protein
MEPNTELVTKVRKLMIDKRARFAIRFLPEISQRVGRPIRRSTLYNALQGHRATSTEKQVLGALSNILAEMPDP